MKAQATIDTDISNSQTQYLQGPWASHIANRPEIDGVVCFIYRTVTGKLLIVTWFFCKLG